MNSKYDVDIYTAVRMCMYPAAAKILFLQMLLLLSAAE